MARSVLIAAMTLTVLLVAAPAAQAIPRTYVSGTGSDLSSCTRALPCRELTAALNRTDFGGTIVITDSDSYQPVVLNKPVKIKARKDEEPEIVTNQTAGVVVRLFRPTDDTPDVVLRGISFRDVVGAGNSTGVSVVSAGDVKLQDVEIENLTAGVYLPPIYRNRLSVLRSTFSRTLYGIYVDSTEQDASVVVEHSAFKRVGFFGIRSLGRSLARLIVSDTTFDGRRGYNNVGVDWPGFGVTLRNTFTGFETAFLGRPVVGDTLFAFNTQSMGVGVTQWPGNRFHQSP